MSNQNRFLLHHQSATSGACVKLGVGSSSLSSPLSTSNRENENQLSVDDNFDSYWEEEARNPHRNRIRIGRQYQATVPQLLKTETRSLLGRDVTIADLNRIRHKEGLSLASVIQPNRHSSNNYNVYSQSSQQQSSATSTNVEQKSPNKSPQNSTDYLTGSSSSIEAPTNSQTSITQENFAPNPPLMKALSHFISLHHPCHHDTDCKKLLKNIALDDEDEPTVSIKASNLREKGSSSSHNPIKETKASRSRSTANHSNTSSSKGDDSELKDPISNEQEQSTSDTNNQPGPSHDWTREEVAMFSKAIEVCGKNFGSIKKEFLPSKSVRSIVEYYYIGSREAPESKRKPSQNLDTTDGFCDPERSQANNGSGDGGNGCDQSSPNVKGGSNMILTANRGSAGPNGKSENGSNIISTDVSVDSSKQAHNNKNISNKVNLSARQMKVEDSNNKSKLKNIDPRMSVYNFDDEVKDDNSPIQDSPCPGAEVKPLKAKPILPNIASGSEAGNSNVGSLKFFMDGQLVLKLNACQEQQKCHWVQSGDKIPSSNQRQKRYSKRTNDRMTDLTNRNGSHSISVNDDDLKTDDLTAEDEDSKESGNSFSNVVTPRQASFSASPSPKRSKVKTDSNQPLLSAQMSSPIDYNRLAVTNMKERNDNTMNSSMNTNIDTNNILTNPMMNPWLQQANSLAMNLFSLFPQAANNLVAGGQVPPPMPNLMNIAPRPMDLSIEHSHSQKPIQPNSKPASRSKSKQRNN